MSRRLPKLGAARFTSISRIGLIALILAPWSVSEVRAQERPALPEIDFGIAGALSIAQPFRVSELEQGPFQIAPVNRGAGTSATLKSLYASTAVMQGLDVHSTMAVLKHGGGEANPLMGGLVTNKAAFIGVKAAVAAGTIMAAHKIGKRNKVAAVVTLVAINSAYAFVVQHNYRVARSLQ
jgi:Domain of unknown function (DUF5658)